MIKLIKNNPFFTFIILFTLFLLAFTSYGKATSENTHNQTKQEFRDLYFHKVDYFSISTFENNVLVFEKLFADENFKVIIVEDVPNGESNWYEYDSKYSTWSGHDENYDNKITIHISKDTEITGGQFKSSKTHYAKTKLITH